MKHVTQREKKTEIPDSHTSLTNYPKPYTLCSHALETQQPAPSGIVLVGSCQVDDKPEGH